MNYQQAMHSKSFANGFSRRARSENKLQSGKSSPNRSTKAGVGGKVGVDEGPRDRLIYSVTCLMGHHVEVQLRNGSVYFGTCYTTNIDQEFGIILKRARLTKDVSFQGQKEEAISKPLLNTLIIPGKEVVQVIAKDVSITMDGAFNELQPDRQQEIMLDSSISHSHFVEAERELEPWIPDEDDPQCPELENIFDRPWNRGWDQFETNEMLFGVKSTFDEGLYTTKLERGPQMRELEMEATRIAREIEGEDTQDLHLAEERGILPENHDIDEETKFSSVYRGRGIDDSGYEEDDDIMLDLCNSETFRETSASSVKNTDLTHGKSNDEAQNEAECSQSNTGAGSYDNARQLPSEVAPKNFPTCDSGSRHLENLNGEHGKNESIKEFVEELTVVGDAQLRKVYGSRYGQKDAHVKGVSSPNPTIGASSSHVNSKLKDKINSPVESSGGEVFVKGAGETRSINTYGQSGISTSSNSDCIGATLGSNGPLLSPSSSVASISSEKPTLNPHAKEFKLNPNAKSFTPSQTPVRPPSPVSNGSYYFPANISTLPLHGLPMDIGIGPSFAGHQPVILSPAQVAPPLQTPQAYYHPGGPQYGQQMLLGHPRPVLYMSSYQPEMPYKGREF